ncbi:hypothetical protein [Lysobacter gummosus]|uniref:hypothetical protein n=1 Tax=Lysobacter gummosus TaxID=262324 RepID=UPI00363D1C30
MHAPSLTRGRDGAHSAAGRLRGGRSHNHGTHATAQRSSGPGGRESPRGEGIAAIHPSLHRALTATSRLCRSSCHDFVVGRK